jgi:hypothetical protein
MGAVSTGAADNAPNNDTYLYSGANGMGGPALIMADEDAGSSGNAMEDVTPPALNEDCKKLPKPAIEIKGRRHVCNTPVAA